MLRRLREALTRLRGGRGPKSHRLSFVTVNGHRYKRLILRDSYLAAEIARSLRSFGETPHIPTLVMRHENEIWVEFVEGSALAASDPGAVSMLAAFYAAVYARAPRQVSTAGASFHRSFLRDLHFLHRVGVLSDASHGDLVTVAERLAPEQAWVGFDYKDPLLKNFVVRNDDGGLCAVDVKSLTPDTLIGIGVAKALDRWLEPHREAFFAEFRQHGAPDFAGYFPYVELFFTAHWTKRACFAGRSSYLDPERFERFRPPR